MVKRPLLLVLASFILGSLCYQVSFGICLLTGVAITIGMVFFLVRISKNRHDFAILIVPVFFFLGNLLMADQQQPGPIDSYLIKSDSITATVKGTVHSIQSTKNSYKIILEQVQYEMTQVPSKYIVVYYQDISGLSIGNKIKVTGELHKFASPTNAYQFDEASYYKIQSVDYKMYAKSMRIESNHVNVLADDLYRVRISCDQVFSDTNEEEVAESLSAMLLGEKAAMEEETKDKYQAGGIAHIISISGLHVALLGMAIFTLFQKIIGLKAGVVSSIFFIFCYGILTNFSVSTNRAVIMLILFLLAKIVGRTYDLLSAVSLSALLILFREPMQVFQCGFLLSYGAILGIAILYPCICMVIDEDRLQNGVNWNDKQFGEWQKRCRSILLKIRYYVVKTLLLQLSIFMVTLPILLWFYYRIATYSFVLNLLVLPLMTYVVLFGVLGALFGCFFPVVGQILLLPSVYIIRWYLVLCEAVTKLPFYYAVAGKPGVLQLVIYGIVVVAGIVLLNKKYRTGFLFLLFGVIVLFIKLPTNELSVTSVDVGQGDCYVIRSTSGKTYVIDGGSTSEKEVGKYRILPYLYGSGISAIEDVFVSHGDEDHISGIIELLEAAGKGEITIHQLIVARTSFEDTNLEGLIEKAKECGVKVGYMEQGGYVKEGELAFTCLHPTYEYKPVEANDYSLVLSLTYRNFSMLFMGDLTSEAEAELNSHNELMQYDVLKVAHHGSKYSTSEALLEKLSPRLALISCGKENRYGHPHAELLARLEENQVTTYMTPKSGMIFVVTDGETMSVRGYVGDKYF